VGRSVCQRARADASAVTALIRRFEEACRRIIKVSQSDYDQLGGSLLYQALHGLSLTPEPPPARGLFLVGAEGGREGYDAWVQSEVGLHPQREAMLGQQQDRLCCQAAEGS